MVEPSARLKKSTDPYLSLRGSTGFDAAVGEHVRSLALDHAARDGVVKRPCPSQPYRIMVLLDGDAESVAIAPHLVRALHAPHLARIDELGLAAICYLPTSVPVSGEGGRFEALPEILLAGDGKGLILWRDADRSYAVAGWMPYRAGLFGGRYAAIHSALSWYQRALDIEAGRANDFAGV